MSLYKPVPSVKQKVNELDPTLLSINSMNPWVMNDSSPRGSMFSSSHIAQALVIEGGSPRRCQTGTEAEFGKYTFKHDIPCDAEIIRVIPKFRKTMGFDSIPNNPSTLVIYEDIKTKRVDMVELTTFSTATDNKHQHFGFGYEFEPVAQNLSPGMKIPKGTVLADSPSVVGEGEHKSYNYGIEANVAFMSIPGIIEDGVVVSEDFLEQLTTTGYEKRVVSFGKKYYPLNLYGDDTYYKPFPEMGDKIREDGLLFALRPYDELLGPIEMDPVALREPDYIFDKLMYGVPGGEVVDITVHHDDTNKVPPTPEGMGDQITKYYNAQVQYYRTILEVYNHLKKERRNSLDISPELHRLVVEAMSYVGFVDNPATSFMKRKDPLARRRVQKLYRRNEIDDWRIEIAFKYPVVPKEGFKLTELHGGFLFTE